MSSSTSSPTSDPLAVARVMGVRGLGGELRVMPLSDAPDRLKVGSQVVVEGETAPRRITEAGVGRHGVVIRLEGVTTRDQGTALVGRHLLVAGPNPRLPAGTYWWHELEGLEVVDPDGTVIGRLEEVFRAGGNEVYRVVGEGGELLVPALQAVVLDIDLAAGRMVVRPPSEWLEEA